MANPPPATSQNQDRLAAYFTSHPTPDHPSRWDSLWKAGDFLPWDRGCANPALIDLLLHPSTTIPDTLDAVASESASFILDAPTTLEGKRKRVLIPGCGKGYDVALFAAAGYDAYGLEVSEKAAQVAREWLKSEDALEGKEGEYRVRDESTGKGKMEVLQGDFFEDGWLNGNAAFDVIYDNTVRGWYVGCV
jgi:SAM-dependent methyltransferase